MGGDQQLRPVDKTIASTVGGSAAGAVAGLIRGYPSQALLLHQHLLTSF